MIAPWMRIRRCVLGSVMCAMLPAAAAAAQNVDVHASVHVVYTGTKDVSRATSPGDVVVWLTPVSGAKATVTRPLASGRYRLAQKEKQFTPHLLVVPTGASVEFPNEDPFFHNVFSLFNGKRFDLGLYEAGSTRAVHFDHEGVSYIFCNIHPEMSAVVIALSSPYFGISSSRGNVVIHDVAPDLYDMHVWAERSDPSQLAAATRRVRIGAGATDLGPIDVVENANAMPHTNKFGEKYPTPSAPQY